MADETQALIDALEELADELGSTPRSIDVREHDELSISAYQRVFGSWNEALREAGFEVNNAHNVTEEQLCADLRAIAEETGSLPKVRDIKEYGEYSSYLYYDRFGGIEEAQKAAGLVTI